MGKNQSIYYHYYPKLENMVSKVRCTRGRIRNDDDDHTFKHDLRGGISQTDTKQYGKLVPKKKISTRSKSRNNETTRRCNIAASLFCNRFDSTYGIFAPLKTHLICNLVSSLYPEQIVFLIALLLHCFLFTFLLPYRRKIL